MGLFNFFGEPESSGLPSTPNISEPVVSLGESMLVLDDWEEVVPRVNRASWQTCGLHVLLNHKSHDLSLRFDVSFTEGNIDYLVVCNWMTPSERRYINGKLKERKDLEQAGRDEAEHKAAQAERDKFMVLVTN